MAKVIIFGIKDSAELAHFYLTSDSKHKVLGFTVNKDFLVQDSFKGLPVIPFEELENYYSPDSVMLFAPAMAKKMNQQREKIYLEGKKKGYNYISYISSKATYYNTSVGENCFIMEDNTIQPFTTIGNNCILWSGNHIGHHSTIADYCFFTSHVVLSGHCIVDSHCYFGVNSTIKDNLHIAKGTLVGMGASIMKDTEEWGIYSGTPAERKGKIPSYRVY